MLKAGIYGYILKNETPKTIISALHTIVRGNKWYNQNVASKIAKLIREMESGVNSLTKREKDVMVHLARGMNNDDISETLNMSKWTIRFHLNNIYSKLYINSGAKAIVWAIEKGYGKKE